MVVPALNLEGSKVGWQSVCSLKGAGGRGGEVSWDKSLNNATILSLGSPAQCLQLAKKVGQARESKARNRIHQLWEGCV